MKKRTKIEPASEEELDAEMRPTRRTDAKLLRIMAEDEPTLDAAVDALARTSTAEKKPDAGDVREQLEEIAELVDQEPGRTVSSDSQ